MTDRELLEKAAKAHGGIPMRCVGAVPGLYCCDEPGKPPIHLQWNPLADDGDALRLGVKLGVNLVISPEAAISDARVPLKGGHWCTEPHIGSDSAAATRRAIVRAAAEIWDATGGKE